ncbi:hypothetical protein L0152_32120, partial [bacterium]|nr:hypothetical protein [bacterium]
HDGGNAWCGEVGGSCVSQPPKPECREPNNQDDVQWCVMHGAPTIGTSDPPKIPDYALCQLSTGIMRLDCSDLSSNILCAPNCSDSNSVRTNTDPE